MSSISRLFEKEINEKYMIWQEETIRNLLEDHVETEKIQKWMEVSAEKVTRLQRTLYENHRRFRPKA